MTDDPILLKYHDKEWGVPVFDDVKLFELLTLEIFQAGLSWRTILKYRSGLKTAFADFNYQKVSQFTNTDLKELMVNKNIIRNHSKIEATIENGKAIMMMNELGIKFSQLIWQPVNFKHLNRSAISGKMDRQKLRSLYVKLLKNNHFKRVGPITVYSFWQASGIINDHEKNCFRYKELFN